MQEYQEFSLEQHKKMFHFLAFIKKQSYICKKYEKVSGLESVQMPKVEEVEYSDDDFPFLFKINHFWTFISSMIFCSISSKSCFIIFQPNFTIHFKKKEKKKR